MNLRSLLRIAIQCFRFALLPFPIAFALIAVGSWAVAHLGQFGHGPVTPEVPSHEGIVMIVGVGFFIQAILGMPSLWMLDKFAHGLRRYLAFGASYALSLSVLVAFLFPDSEDTSTPTARDFLETVLSFGLPLVLSYLLAWYLGNLRLFRHTTPLNPITKSVAS